MPYRNKLTLDKRPLKNDPIQESSAVEKKTPDFFTFLSCAKNKPAAPTNVKNVLWYLKMRSNRDRRSQILSLGAKFFSPKRILIDHNFNCVGVILFQEA